MVYPSVAEIENRLARIELKGGVDEDDLAAVLLPDGGEGDHGRR